jgi:SNF2 family DNA or RNA helicase
MQFKTQPYAHQLKAFERFKDSEYFALFMDMGTGKTKTTIDIAAHKFETGQINALLIIAPNHVHEQWIDEELKKHCPVNYRPFTWYSGKVGNAWYNKTIREFIVTEMPFLKVLSINVEAFQADTVIPYVADFVKLHKPLIVIDEATRIKNHTAKRTKTVHKLTKYGQRAILTGTPTAKSPFDLWSMMEFLKPNFFNCNFFVYQHRYGVMMRGTNPHTGGRFETLIDAKTFGIVQSQLRRMRESRNGDLMPDDYEAIAAITGVSEKSVRFIETTKEFTRFKRLDELRDYIAPTTFSVRKDDCLDLPAKVYEKLYVDMSDEQYRVYKDLKRDLLATYGDKELSVMNKAALMTRLMQVAGGFFPFMEEEQHFSPEEHRWYTKIVGSGMLIGKSSVKLDAIMDDMEEVGDDIKVIVWAHFVPELKHIYEVMNKRYRCALYYGGTIDRDRSLIIQEFKAGKYDVFIGNAQTAGFGLNLQNATLQYFYSNTFRTEERLQAEDRSHRIGVKSTCVYKDVIVRGTVDEKVYESIKAGRDMNDYFKRVSLKELLSDDEEVQF